MRVLTLDGLVCGIVPRTIGGPYAVLVAEQLHAAGARLIVGLICGPGIVVPAASVNRGSRRSREKRRDVAALFAAVLLSRDARRDWLM